jgi:hypothetical protein
MHVSKWWLRGASGRNYYSSCLEKQSNKMKHHTPLITTDKSCSRFIFWKVGVSLQSCTKITTFSRSIFLKTAVGERGGVEWESPYVCVSMVQPAISDNLFSGQRPSPRLPNVAVVICLGGIGNTVHYLIWIFRDSPNISIIMPTIPIKACSGAN